MVVIITIQRHKLLFLHGSGKIGEWVKIEYLNDGNNCVSHEIIYYSLFYKYGVYSKKSTTLP
jgi:hypothetical protein